MKILIAISLIALSMPDLRAQAPTDLWSVRFHTIDSFQVSMKDYKGKMLLIATIDAASPNTTHLAQMDSINRIPNGNIAVIGILVDYSGKPQKRDSLLRIIRAGRGLSYPVMPVTNWKQENGKKNDNPVIGWLKDGPDNQHFKIQPREAEQIFLVSEKGSLFAVLSGGSLDFPGKLNLVLNKKHVQ